MAETIRPSRIGRLRAGDTANHCRMKLEGIVSKRLDSRYRSGRSQTWIKVKNKLAPAYIRVLDGIS
jgi:hypothetical protein